MPQGVYVENPDDGTKRVKPEADGSLNVNVQTVGEDVEFPPSAADIRSGGLTATGTLFTVPANRVFKGSLTVSASISVAGTCSPVISSANTGGGSGATTGTLHQITVAGLALSVAAAANTITDVYVHGGTNGATITFTQGASGQSTGQVAGRLLL